MTSRIGSDQNFIATTSAGILDDQANSIVSSDTTFGSSPLGVAARTQALYGIANANFNLTPPDPTLPIVDNDNPLPYWTITDGTEGDGSAIAVFDESTSTWGVQLSLGTTTTDAAITMTTRSFLLTDDNLALRQKALAVLSKSGTAGGTAAQWSLVLSAEYFSSDGSSLSSYAIGTVTDVGTWTSMSGTTTAGGSAISSSAEYVDLTFTMTALGTVTGTAKPTIKSLLLTTSTPGGGGSQSFLVTETFTANETWNRPTGVEYLVAAVAAGGGGGGGSGQIRTQDGVTSMTFNGAGGGAGGNWWLIRDLYVGDQSSISIGIGAGGAGGSAVTFNKAAGVNAEGTVSGIAGGNGGSTTLGAYVTVFGGRGASASTGDGSTGPAGGAAGSATTSPVFGPTLVTAGAGARGGGSGGGSAATGDAGGFSPFTVIPYSPVSAAGSSGASSTGAGATHTAGAAGASIAGLSGGGGASGGGVARGTSLVGASGSGNYGGGGGGGSRAIFLNAGTVTITATGGNGGDGVNEAGGGGGGSIALCAPSQANNTSSSEAFTSGKGGDGSSGFVTLVYIA